VLLLYSLLETVKSVVTKKKNGWLDKRIKSQGNGMCNLSVAFLKAFTF
jgi:hypothetical protein